jgi:cytochrome c peroxidase
MPILSRTRLVLSVVVEVTVTALILVCGAGRPQAGSAKESASDNSTKPPTGKAPLIPKAGPLAKPRSVQQLGVPAELTRTVIPPDNPQTPEKIALGQKLFFDGRLSADATVACATCHDPARAFTDARPVSIGIRGRAG